MAGLESSQVLKRRRGHLRSGAGVECTELRGSGASEGPALDKSYSPRLMTMRTAIIFLLLSDQQAVCTNCTYQSCSHTQGTTACRQHPDAVR